jgi:hypothetical protein
MHFLFTDTLAEAVTAEQMAVNIRDGDNDT